MFTAFNGTAVEFPLELTRDGSSNRTGTPSRYQRQSVLPSRCFSIRQEQAHPTQRTFHDIFVVTGVE